MSYEIRLARDGDAEDVSRVILRALRETNARDYSPEIIERLALNFSPSAVLALMRSRKVFVAVAERQIVGTASLDGRTVRSVFVSPDAQGRGIGRLLVGAVERAAHEVGVKILMVPSSITAEPLYSKLGFKAVGDTYHGEERTIIMERSLVPL